MPRWARLELTTTVLVLLASASLGFAQESSTSDDLDLEELLEQARIEGSIGSNWSYRISNHFVLDALKYSHANERSSGLELDRATLRFEASADDRFRILA